jgi:hypothetical protein
MYRWGAILMVILFSCHQRESPLQKEISLKDSMVKDYLRLIDRSENFHDSLNFDYKILRAYMNDDSGFFEKMKYDWDNGRLKSDENYFPDTCKLLPKLSDLPVEVAYRFTHNQSFCDYNQVITISQSKDSIQYDYAEYNFVVNQDGIKMTNKDGSPVINCIIKKAFSKNLNKKFWDSLDRKLREADFWGMKTYHYEPILDGSFWKFEGYIKNPGGPEWRQNHFVYRHCPCHSAFKEIGLYLFRISGEKTLCGNIF